MTRIVTTHYRYKPPPKKRKAVALPTGRIVRRVEPLDPSIALTGPIEVAPSDHGDSRSNDPTSYPASGVRKPQRITKLPSELQAATSSHGGAKSAIVRKAKGTRDPSGGPVILPPEPEVKSVKASDQFPEPPANDDQKPAIVTSISRKRARQRRARYTPAEAEPDHDPPDDTLMQAMARMIGPPGAG